MTTLGQKSKLNRLTVSLILLVVLLASACTYFIFASLNQKPIQTPPTQTTIVQQIAQDKQIITCPEINQHLEIVDTTTSFNTAYLAPLETTISTNVLFNEIGILLFKHFNAGGKLYSVEENTETKRFGGHGPYFVAEILHPTEQNTSLVPTFYLPEEVNEQLLGSDVQSTAVSLKNSWYFLSITGCDFGCNGAEYLANQKLIRVTFSEENKETVQFFSLPANLPLLDKMIGYKDSMILFSARDNKTQFAGFNSETNTWKQLTEADLTKAVINTQSVSEKVNHLIEQNRCFSYKTPGAGTLLFTPHTVSSNSFNAQDNNNLLDVYFDGTEKQLEVWKK